MVKKLATEDAILHAADILKKGGLVAFPTETVYGLGADAFNGTALANIFAAKHRPTFDPLIIHLNDPDSLDRVADRSNLNSTANLDTLSAALWPGPLTIILPKQRSVPDLATSGLPTVAVRIPDHPVALSLIRHSTGAIAAPSANRFGQLSPTTADHVEKSLGDAVDMILDGGPTGIGVESTILDLSADHPRILRPGGTTREQIESLIGPVELFSGFSTAPTAPGQLKSHYAPRTALECFEKVPALKDAAYLFFDGRSRDQWREQHTIPVDERRIRVLSEDGSLTEAAANLFALLHALDTSGADIIYVQRVPDQGLGTAINDRLSRASHHT
ncbi:threonylcarbamoyl-AMP synthase [Spirochaetia bacterium]|nr:threonylcarbamoyl-AMP synthase [Spirochaetia bacterium]